MATPMEVKVCIIGDTDVGKTSLSTRYCHGEFPQNSTPTIGASFLQRRVMVDGTWLRDLKSHADPNVVICLAGNKCDKTAAFDLSQCEVMAKNIGGSFFRTSALTGEGVQEIFETLSRRVAEVYRGSKGSAKEYDALKLGVNNKKESSGGCC
eukprot:gene605-654_t